MRLKNIKLAGFKSFVEPTTVFFPSALVAVVGPNGCGKSNIIDAVRWVMGESSAKNLRGESMIDVIFNGSSQRKPVGQASVELIFENDSGRLQGEFLSYHEISIKRIVTRDAQSMYFINGTKCRKKDVTDIFLGTGLGPRSYSLIGQGTVTRIIEAKPEDLRIFLEEAAGISKYKERRRETENRIRHTKDNLLRVTDLREELGKQLERLKRQASAAERYKTLKSEERLYKAQLLTLRWLILNDELINTDKLINETQLKHEGLLTEQNRIDIIIDELRSSYQRANDSLNKAQGDFYRIGADITRLEDNILHQKERAKKLSLDLSQAKQDWQQAVQHLEENQQKALMSEESIATLMPKRVTLNDAYKISQSMLEAFECEKEAWQEQWDVFIQSSAESSKVADIEQSKIQQFQLQLNTIELKLSKLQEEKNTLDISTQEKELIALNEELTTMEAQHEAINNHLEDLNETFQSKRLDFELLENEFYQVRSQLSQEKAKEGALLQLQQSALGHEDEHATQWLKTHKLETVKRLAQLIDVDEGFEGVLEMVLGDRLEALCVEDISKWELAFSEIKKGALTFIEPHIEMIACVSANFPALYQKVKSTHSVCQNLLTGIYIAEDLSQALSWLPYIGCHESIAVHEGILLGKGWCRIMRAHDPRSGVIAREKVILLLQEKIAKEEITSDHLKKSLSTVKNTLNELEAEKESAHTQLNEKFRRLADFRSNIQVKSNKLTHIKTRIVAIDTELLSEKEHKKRTYQALEISEKLWENAMKQRALDVMTREELMQSQKHINETLAQHRSDSSLNGQALHELELLLKTKQSDLSGTKALIHRDVAQVDILKNRVEKLVLTFESNQEKEAESSQLFLEEALKTHSAAEELLNKEKEELDNIKQLLTNSESEKSTFSSAISIEQTSIDSLRIDRQTLLVKKETIEGTLLDNDHQLTALIDLLPSSASISLWDEKIKTIAIKISRLGAINLAAIDEYEIESKRKIYLDEQFDDLAKALEMLEMAINKIDKETRARFRDTYEKVNAGFKVLFPRLFGGGEAELSLMGDDLLNTGVTVMARPPGKRNSTIHLLSGGEKALTAVALIFAIFQLNPSPFCMLDEVDAPLDDTNVHRFCALVKDMASKVQFIFISHNKVAMEMANQLLGVTMLEPGVSRIVSVDVDEAMAIAN